MKIVNVHTGQIQNEIAMNDDVISLDSKGTQLKQLGQEEVVYVFIKSRMLTPNESEPNAMQLECFKSAELYLKAYNKIIVDCYKQLTESISKEINHFQSLSATVKFDVILCKLIPINAKTLYDYIETNRIKETTHYQSVINELRTHMISLTMVSNVTLNLETVGGALKQINHLQLQMYNSSIQLQHLSDMFASVQNEFSYLLTIHRMPSALIASYYEQQRRLNYDLLVDQFEQFNRHLESREEKKRAFFKQEIEHYLPFAVTEAVDEEELEELVESLPNYLSQYLNKRADELTFPEQSSLMKIQATRMKMKNQIAKLSAEFNYSANQNLPANGEFQPILDIDVQQNALVEFVQKLTQCDSSDSNQLVSKLQSLLDLKDYKITSLQSQLQSSLEFTKELEANATEMQQLHVAEFDRLFSSTQTKNIHDLIARHNALLSFSHFKITDLCLFLPTRNPKAWAAFNVGFPHYFLKSAISQQPPDVYKLTKEKEWLLARIVGVEEYCAEKGNLFRLKEGTLYWLLDVVLWINEGQC